MLNGNPNQKFYGATAFNQGPFGQAQGTQNPYGLGYQQTAGRLAPQPLVQQNSSPGYQPPGGPPPKPGSPVYPHPPNPEGGVNVIGSAGFHAQADADRLLQQLELYYASLRPGPGRAVHMIGY